MFERYTEKARRVIFFARYEASQFGSPYIESEHLLMGLLREDKALSNRFLRSHAGVESIRKQIDAHTTIREKISTSVDLPLSNESKRVLAYAAEEAERLGHKHIGTEHLLLGLLREEACFAAEMLKERGIKLEAVREDLAKMAHESAPSQPAETHGSPARHFRDLTQDAIDGTLAPVVGREVELDAVIEVLAGGRTRNPLLVGERGCGKRAIVEALAQCIADGSAAPLLAEKRVMALELFGTGNSSRERLQIIGELNKTLTSLAETSQVVLFVGDLQMQPAGDPVLAQIAPALLKPDAVQSGVQCIAACTPAEYRELAQSASWLADAFRAVHVRPLGEDETLAVLKARRLQLVEAHAVKFEDEALETAAKSSGRYLAERVLPGKAFELLDAAAARVKLRQSAALPEEFLEVQKRIRFVWHRLEAAIANHEFEKARFYSDEEKKEREKLRELREKHHVDNSEAGTVLSEDVEAVIARWSKYPFQP
ncbi:MAG TPA: Clp protease N-terminal domain-containing protein [Terracidiphilus sp.]|nr:Clp protease N-terminal domain-containing protein [Terracidiphilus sp.]